MGRIRDEEVVTTLSRIGITREQLDGLYELVTEINAPWKEVLGFSINLTLFCLDEIRDGKRIGSFDPEDGSYSLFTLPIRAASLDDPVPPRKPALTLIPGKQCETENKSKR